ncbi:divisome protein SepX/GlpR [Streptomyces spongiae]|uniref:Uncharacterized protein n=1 Tax=Streptomyces spongiae TaxID=565072 RepID=A0A5N8XXF5_9ACTN|nr:gephyrin-like molybdotransferase receptor GlpR [Streptomyces spongiae]MPY64054.1 hypothetical protein [Streptomyces spongiae]
MSSSGLIYAVIVGAWAAYLVPMWLRRQDELNEARPTERFSTAIRLLSGRAGMERRYAKDLRARSTDEEEHAGDPGVVTDSVDVRAFAMPPHRPQTRTHLPAEPGEPKAKGGTPQGSTPQGGAPHGGARSGAPAGGRPVPKQSQPGGKAQPSSSRPAAMSASGARGRRGSSAESAARAQRSKVLARRRRTTVMLFLAFTLGAIVAAVGGLALLWAPGVPAVMLSVYIAYLRVKERRRFAYKMDRRRAEAAAKRLRERQPRRRPTPDADTDEPEDGPETGTDPGLSALAADRRALVEQTDHAEWVDQQRERQRRPGQGDSWDPVPVPLPTYVTAPVAPRATPNVDLGAPDSWSSARSSAVGTGAAAARDPKAQAPSSATQSTTHSSPESSASASASASSGEGPAGTDSSDPSEDGRSDARRAASARRARERGRTPLFDQYEDGDRPKAANE